MPIVQESGKIRVVSCLGELWLELNLGGEKLEVELSVARARELSRLLLEAADHAE